MGEKPTLQQLGGRARAQQRPASGKPASGMPATGAGTGGPARGASTAPPLDGTLQPTPQQRLDSAAMRALAREKAEKALRALEETIDDRNHPRRVDAAEKMLARAYGPPSAAPDSDSPGGTVTITWGGKSG